MKIEQLKNIVVPLLDWYHNNSRKLPWRESKDPYRIWVSEIMLQQTRVEAVLSYYERFMEHFPTVESLAACDDEVLFKLWEGLGYYTRARNLKKAAQIICTHFQGQFPRQELAHTQREQLHQLPLNRQRRLWMEMCCV